LHVEFTPFSISGRHYHFIRLGSWSIKNPAVTPNEIWCARDYSVLELRIATISMIFSSKDGLFYECDDAPVRERECKKDSIKESSDSSSEDKAEEVEAAEKVLIPTNLFLSIQLCEASFSFLHSLGINKDYQINALIQELVNLKGETGVIEYKQKNNHPGFLLQVPSVHCTSRYRRKFSRQSSFTDAAVKVISKSIQCTEGEAAECLIESLFKRYEEAFMPVAKNNGFIVPVGKKWMPYKLKLCSMNVGLERIPCGYCFVI